MNDKEQHTVTTCVDEALQSLREKPVHSATMDRLRLTLEADALVKSLPQPIQLSKGLAYILDHIVLPVHPHDLIVGRIAEEVPDADGEALIIHAQGKENWNKGTGMPPWMRDVGHACFDWETLLLKGLPGLQADAMRNLEQRKMKDQNATQIVFLEGAVGLYQSLRLYARRYADAADRAGLHSSGDVCRAIADAPPQNFTEATQLMWLVGLVFCAIVTPNSALTFGRMDQLLLPFFRKDIAAGRLTRQMAGDLILDFYCKTNLLLGRGEHQMSHWSEKSTGFVRNLSYDYTPYILIGGRRKDGSAPVNELTELFIAQVMPRFETPIVVLRYTPDMPDAIWQMACDKMRQNASVFVYNDARVIPALEHWGVSPDTAVEYTMRGCNAVALPGSNQCAEHYLWLINHVRNAVVESTNAVRTIDDVYAIVRSKVRTDMEGILARMVKQESDWNSASSAVLRLEDCLSIGPIERARSSALGGDTDHGAQLCIGTLSNAADSMASVDTLVFRTGAVTLLELVQAIGSDFAGHDRLHRMCVQAPKFGRDDDRADLHAVRLLTLVLDEFDRIRKSGGFPPRLLLPCTQSNLFTILGMRKEVGATPDGRKAGQPLSDNTSPSSGSCTRGPTAMFASLAKLPMDRLCSGALNVRLHPNHFSGPNGTCNLASLLRTYLDNGGLQVQLSMADTDELRDAQVHPEKHRDLMVRITGYSAAFVDMDRNAQNEIIRREEMTA